MILDKIVAATKTRIERAKELVPHDKMMELALKSGVMTGFPFEKALRKQDISFICEVKKASPSKGILVDDFPYLLIARGYERAGADAISVLTEPKYFKGGNNYLAEIKNEVSIPLLRKDFIIDSYQLYETKVLGASAVLLICALLETETLKKFISICNYLGLSVLTEAHDEKEIESALAADAGIIGVNNRNLRDFSVDISTSVRLRKYVPEDVLFIAESGIRTAEDVERMREAGVNGVLIGEALMQSQNKKGMLEYLRGKVYG
ncbi:MAG: indole-3-glycerol phosphate synthase TrpC [Acetivibrionales bacterium]|jgi:indole-3-glycerol phosphate synthase